MIDVETAIADAHRREWAYVLAATVRIAGDIDLAESVYKTPTRVLCLAGPSMGFPPTRARG